MKQQIVKISNIRFKDFNGINRLVDVKETAAYEFLSQRNPNIFDIDVAAAYVKTKLLYEYDVLFELETIDIDTAEYRNAQRSIDNYEDFDCFADDAGAVYEQHPFKQYVLSWPTVMYMHHSEWHELGYGAFISGKDWHAALEQVSYEYLLRFMPVYIS